MRLDQSISQSYLYAPVLSFSRERALIDRQEPPSGSPCLALRPTNHAAQSERFIVASIRFRSFQDGMANARCRRTKTEVHGRVRVIASLPTAKDGPFVLGFRAQTGTASLRREGEHVKLDAIRSSCLGRMECSYLATGKYTAVARSGLYQSRVAQCSPHI